MEKTGLRTQLVTVCYKERQLGLDEEEPGDAEAEHGQGEEGVGAMDLGIVTEKGDGVMMCG